MNQFGKGLVVGILATLLLMLVPGLAQGTQAMIEVFFNQVTIEVDSEVVPIDNILYKGTTYAPLRAVAEMVGKQVDYNNQTKTVYLQDAAQPSVNEQIMAVKGIAVGMTEQAVLEAMGQPAYKAASIYGFDWYVYNRDYGNYLQIGIRDGLVEGLFSNSGDWQLKGTVGIGATRETVTNLFGESSQEVKDGLSVYQLTSTSEALYEIDDLYVWIYYDTLGGDKVMGTLLLDKSIPFRSIYYGDYSQVDLADLAAAYEQQILDLCNGYRVEQGLAPFTWDEDMAQVARAHSADMTDNNYFSHTNLQGQSPFDRMQEAGLSFWTAGENIAYGQRNALQAFVGWINSSGHRQNIIDNYSHLGVGVVIREEDLQPYYTQNFYTPR